MHQGRRRRGTHLLGCKPNVQVSAAVDGPVGPNATTASERTPAAPLNGTKAQFLVNGYVRCGSEGTSTEESRPSAVSDGDAPVGISGRGPSGPDAQAVAHNSDQVAPEQGPTPARKSTRRKKFRHKKSQSNPGKCEVLLLPPRNEENWENEIQGPEDVLQFELQDLTLPQRVTGDLPVTPNYSPAAHHPRPLRWFCHRIPTEPDQFADAEDAAGPFSCAGLQAASLMVSPNMKAVMDAVWVVWSIGASIYDYIHTNAMEERIHALENVITIHQCVIGLLSAGVLALFTYIVFKKL